MSLTLDLEPGATLGTLREARVTSHCDGLPPVTFRVCLDGEEHVILAPPKDCPAVGARVTLRLTDCGWAYAGGPRS